MTDGKIAVDSPVGRLARFKAQTLAIRERAEKLHAGGATGIQIAASISDATDEFLIELLEDSLSSLDASQRNILQEHSAMVAVGGSGRGEMAPYSDVDLLFLYDGRVQELFRDISGQIVRDCWDSGIKLGHSVRTIPDSISMAREEPEVATALIEARFIWGSEQLVENLKRKFYKAVVHRRQRNFIDDCIVARQDERDEFGFTVGRLEPDLKCSYGGLRDLHLIRWVGYAIHGTSDLETLRLKGAIGKQDFRELLAAHEFLTKLRIEMHFGAGKPNDLLTREEQLRISKVREIESTAGFHPVERFMQTYFQHSSAIASITKRFVARHRQPTFSSRCYRSLLAHRVNQIFRISGSSIDIALGHRDEVSRSLERMLSFWRSVSHYDVSPAAEVLELFQKSLRGLEQKPTVDESLIFLEILGRSGNLGPVLRGMYETGLLEIVLPEMAHTRNLLQFNQYHSYTVDEHTLRAVEAAEQFAQSDGPVGTAYQAIHHKEILHLALLLHDLGKGFEEDHSEVGKRLAEEVSDRLQLPDHQRDQLVFLVHKHLMMSNWAFRRDLSDPETLLQFSREVGTPDTLRMLYVLTAADLSAVGPGVWTDWKADLLADLFDSTMLILSGKRYSFHEAERISAIKDSIRSHPILEEDSNVDLGDRKWIDKRLDAFTAHYLTATPSERVAADIKIIHRLQPSELIVEGIFDDETRTVDFRIFAGEEFSEGCFHKIAGVLTANRFEILSAQICTCMDGTVVDSFRVVDNNSMEGLPQYRIDEIAKSMRNVLMDKITVQELFQRHKSFGSNEGATSISDLENRVVIDNESSDRRTVIDVFAHDRRGLLYTISHTVFELGLSVVLAKIATRLDQVVDVFYVTDARGNKIDDSTRLSAIRRELEARIVEFESEGYREFLS